MSNRVGLVIGAVFGLIYVVVNAAALGAPVGPVLQVLGIAAFVGLLVVLYRFPQDPADTPGGAVRFGRRYWSIVAAEVVAFVAGIAVLNGPLGLPRAVLPWVTFVVGVHFLGLARVWKAPSLSWLGAGMALCGATGLAAAALGAPTAAIATVAGVAPGALLLAGSWWAATRGGART
ncbi:MAG: hypothetical protein ACRDTT_14245 [Pseudonocardiaceae bacterium]